MNTPEWGAPGVWKFVAGTCLAVMIAGSPAVIYAIRTWSLADQVVRIEERQDDVRHRLTILETRNAVLVEEIVRLRMELDEHAQEIAR